MVRDIARPRWGLCCIGLLLGGCLGGGDSVGPNVGNNSPVSPNEGDVVITQTEIPRAQCREGDRPELALQGQVPLSDRLAGFQGNNCNIDLVSQYEGEGAVGMSTLPSRAANTPFIRNLAQHVLQRQTQETAQMRSLLETR